MSMTIAEFSANNEIKLEALRKRWNSAFPEIPFSKKRILSADEIQQISAPPSKVGKVAPAPSKPRKIPAVKQPVSAIAPEPEPEQAAVWLTMPKLSAPGISWSLLAIVYCHAVLIAYDATILWGYPGAFAGVVALLFVHAAVMVATQPKYIDTSTVAVWLVSLIDFGAWFLHYPTFLPMSKTGEFETKVFCGFVCGCSFAALWLYRYFNTEKYFTNDGN